MSWEDSTPAERESLLREMLTAEKFSVSELTTQVATLNGQLSELKSAALRVCFEPLGKQRATCNAEAMRALDALMTDDDVGTIKATP